MLFRHIGGVLFKHIFLSHLCDVEERNRLLYLTIFFLSHLCDVEVKLFLFKNVSQFTAVTLARRDTMAKLSKAHNISRWGYHSQDFIKLLNNNYTFV